MVEQFSSRASSSISRRAFAGGALATAGLAWCPARAQDKFPAKSIEVVTHSGVGGGTDITARMMMVHAPQAFGAEAVLANRVGGSGGAALLYAARQPRDGHTILLITQSHLLTILQGKTSVKYEDLVGLARATSDPQILMVGKGSPFRTARDLIAAAKGRSLKAGATGIGNSDHVTVFGFATKAGLQQPTIVPFRGGGDIVLSLVGGNVDIGVLNYSEAESQLKVGDVRALLVLAAKRMEVLPDVPTAKEIGIDVDFATFRGFATLKGVPEDRLKTLESGLVEAMKGPMYASYITSSGQAADSVAGRQVWQAQLDAFYEEGKAALHALGITK